MSTSHAVHPYKRLGAVALHVRSVLDAVTNAPLERVVRSDNPEFGRRMIDLTQCDPWHRARLSLDCELDPEELREVVGAYEEPQHVTQVMAMVLAGSSKLRRAAVLKAGKDGKYSGTLDIDRSDLGGSFELQCRVVRRIASQGASQAGIASFAGALLGDADPILFILDLADIPYHGPVRFSWRDFGASEDPELRASAALPLVVNTDGPPTVMLNSGIPDFKAALEGESSAGVNAMLRNGFASMLGAAVWRQLTTASVAAIVHDDDDDDGGVKAPPDWKGAIARSFVGFAYPGTETAEGLKRAFSEFRDAETAQVLIARIGLFADTQARVRKYIDAALKAARKMDGDE